MKWVTKGQDEQSYDALVAIKSEIEQGILRLPGVTGIDVGHRLVDGKQTDEFAIRIYVAESEKIPDVIFTIEEVNGIPVQIIPRTYELH